MRAVFATIFLVSLFSGVCGRCGADEPFVNKVLKDYYESRGKEPLYEEQVRKLGDPDAKARRQAADWLTEILSKSLEDEKSGAAPWRATPFWGSSGENPARNLRTNIARTLAESKEKPAARFPVLRWYFEKEFLPDVQVTLVKVLCDLDSADAVVLRKQIATGPHGNLVVVAEVLRKLVANKETLPAETVAALCQHHRDSVRTPARQLSMQQQLAEPKAFDPEQAMRSAPVRKLLDGMSALLIDGPAANAPWVVASYKAYDNDKKEKHQWQVGGWLVKEKGDEKELFTPFGHRQKVRNRSELTKESEREHWWTCSVAEGKIEDEVAKVEAIRKKGAEEFELSERGPLTGQFQGQGAGLYELILAVRLHAAGRDGLSARILFPALETLYRDDAAISILRRDLGKNYGYEMLVAFAGDRDLARTEAIAKTLAEHYPETIFHHYAVRLAKELPKRRDDFVKLKLPTPAEWAEMKKKLSRAEQIDFLCEHYRLLNYFQAGQPGGYFPGSPQYAEPCGMDSNASWGLGRGKTEVINPEVELTGARAFRGDEKRGMNLTLKEVPQISKHLREDWLIPTVTFWRDFHPDRHLGGTRRMIAGVIDGIATRELCKVEGWDKLTPAEIDREIERINRWALTNDGKSEAELRWDTLQHSIESGKGWFRDIENQVDWFLEKKDPRAYDVMKQMLEREKTDDYEQSQILKAFFRSDPEKAKDLAPKYLTKGKEYVRFDAALIVFQTGEKDKARTILGNNIESGSVDWWKKKAVELLLKDGTAESREQVGRLFKNKELPRGGGSFENQRAEVMRMCVDSGMSEPYSYYLQQLDNIEVAYTSFGGRDNKSTTTTYAQVHAREIVNNLAPDDAAVKDLAKKHPNDVDQIPHLKKWLRAKIAAAK